MKSLDLDAILHDFFALLDARRLPDCEALIQSARDCAKSPVEHAWVDYLEAIYLTDKAPPRWDLAQQKLLPLLALELPDPLLARIHLELAFVADYLGDYQRAIEHNRRSSELFQRLEDHEYLAKVLKNTGIAHTRAFERGQADRGALNQALACHQRSLALCQDLGNERLVATVEFELGTVYKALNRWKDALSQYTARAEKCRRFDWQRSLALTLDNLGETYHHLGQWPQAMGCYREALAILEDLPSPDPYEEADVWANLAQLYQAQGRMIEAVAASDEAIRLIETLRDPLQGENARIGFLGSRIHIYEQRVLLDLARDDPHAALTTLERAKARAFIELLAGYTPPDIGPGDTLPPEQAALSQVKPLTANAIQQRLPPDTVLIEYLVMPGHALAFVVTRDSFAVISLAASLHDDLALAFERDRHRLHHVTPDHDGILHMPWPLPLLRGRLLMPLAQSMAGKSRVVIVPYGLLHYIPFHALFAQASEDHISEIVYTPSATVLLDYCRVKPSTQRRHALVFSAGDDLRYAAREAAVVAARLPVSRPDGAAATLAAALPRNPCASLLHLACHARFDPDDPLASGLALADGRLTMRQVLDELHLEADLVVLSGCETGQSRLHRGDELIGLVRAFIYAGTPSVLVSLWPVDDISTGLLMETFYDHLLASRSPAVALAHAQQTLRTMSTAALNERLIVSGLSLQEANAEIARLRQAAAKIVNLTPGPELLLAHPYFWASFILVGDRLTASE